MLNQNFKYWSSYSESNINNNNIEYYDHNLIYNLDVDWLKLTSNIKISSLDDMTLYIVTF